MLWPCQCICDNWRMAAEFGLESAACNIEIKDKLVAQGKFTLPKLPPKKMGFDFVVLLYYRKYIAGNRLWHVPNDIWTVICTNSNPLVATSCYSMNMPCYAFLHHRHRFVGWCFFFPCFFQEWDTSSNCRSFAGLFGHRAWHESHGDRLGTDRPWWPCFRAHMFFYSTSNRAKMPLKYGELIDRGKGNDNEWHEDSRWSCRRNVAEVTFSWLWVLLTMMMMWICRQL